MSATKEDGGARGDMLTGCVTAKIETALLARVYANQMKNHYETLLGHLCFGCSTRDSRREMHNLCVAPLKDQLETMSDVLLSVVDSKQIETELFSLVQEDNLLSLLMKTTHPTILFDPERRDGVVCSPDFWELVYERCVSLEGEHFERRPVQRFLEDEITELCEFLRATPPSQSSLERFCRQAGGAVMIPRCMQIFATPLSYGGEGRFYYVEPSLWHDVLDAAMSKSHYEPLALNVNDQELYVLGPVNCRRDFDPMRGFLFVRSATTSVRLTAIMRLIEHLSARQYNQITAARLVARYRQTLFDLHRIRDLAVELAHKLGAAKDTKGWYLYRLQNLMVYCECLVRHYVETSPKMVEAARGVKALLRGTCTSQRQSNKCDYTQYFLWHLSRRALEHSCYNFELPKLRPSLRTLFEAFRKRYATAVDLEKVSLPYRRKDYGDIVCDK